MKNTSAIVKILSIDIGGSHIKATILNNKGELQKAYDKVVTPIPANPANVIDSIKKLISAFPDNDHVSVGFPGYVRDGIIKTAPNLGTDDWKDVDFAERLTNEFGKPTKVVNDADMQGLGVVSGKGFEMVLTLGTGFGTALLMDGQLLPHLEVAHHPISKKETYDEYIGEIALERVGKKKWNKRMEKVFEVLKTVFNYDTLYIGGGNADKLTFQLDENMKIVTNEDGIKGGSRLWTVEHNTKTANPSA
jgi:polyphosphate glucokinase